MTVMASGELAVAVAEEARPFPIKMCAQSRSTAGPTR